MKLLSLLICISLVAVACAQDQTFRTITVKQRINIRGRSIDSLSRDTNLTSVNDLTIASALAIKKYINARLVGGVAGVSTFNGRSGSVVPVAGDYSSFFPQLSGSYANPTWITSLPFSKITSATLGADLSLNPNGYKYGVTNSDMTDISGTPFSFQINHGSGNFGLGLIRNDNGASGFNLSFYRTQGSGTSSTKAAVYNGGSLGTIQYFGVPADNTSQYNAASISAYAYTDAPSYFSGFATAGTLPNYKLASHFQFNVTNFFGTKSRAMDILPNGQIILSNTSYLNWATPYKLQVEGNSAFHGAAVVGSAVGVPISSASAQFEVLALDKGVLFPRMSTTERSAISSPAHSLFLFDRTVNRYVMYDSVSSTYKKILIEGDTSVSGNTSQNMANSDLTLTNNRIHNIGNYSLNFRYLNGLSETKLKLAPTEILLQRKYATDSGFVKVDASGETVLIHNQTNGAVTDAVYGESIKYQTKAGTNIHGIEIFDTYSSIFGGIFTYNKNNGSLFTERSLIDKGYADSAIAANTLTPLQLAQFTYAYIQSTKGEYWNNGSGGGTLLRVVDDSTTKIRAINVPTTSEINVDTTASTTDKFNVSLSLVNSSIDLGKIATIGANTLLGNNTGSSANPSALSVSSVKTMLSLDAVDNTSDATKNSATATLTNKRITQRVGTTSSGSTITPTGDASDMYTVTALAAAATIAAPSGTPTDGQTLLIRIKDNGTARALTWNAIYRAGDIALPTTTVISKTMYCQFIYNSADSKWDFIGLTNNL